MLILNMFYIRLYICFFILSNGLYCQNFQFNLNDRAEVLFSNNAYANTPSSLRLSEIFGSSSYYSKNYLILLSKLRNNETGADRQLPYYLEKNPISKLGSTLPFDIGNFYFKNNKYSYALKWYRNLDDKQFLGELKDKFNFNKGYSLFHVKRYSAAKPYLEKVKNTRQYESDAHYYLGHIAYQMDDYVNAQSEFSQLDVKTSSKNDLDYFQVDMNFKLGRFQQAIDLGNKLLKKSNKVYESDLSKIIGESHFNLKNYKESLPFLVAYKGIKDKWTNEDFYQLGYAYYSGKKYDSAIDQFNKIINQSNFLSQNAFYHLGDCYLKEEKKIEALSAFKKASEMNFDKNIKEDALLQYAKLGFEIGNPFESYTNVLIRFLNNYPKNKNLEKIKSLLVLSYTNGGDYDSAIKILESADPFKDEFTLQKVFYLKALELYRSGLYVDAQPFLSNSIKLDKNPVVTARSLLLNGQSQFESNSYGAAKNSFDKYFQYIRKNNLNLDINFWYEIGYSVFNLNNYDLAIQYFENNLKKEKDLSLDYLLDTYLRLADSYFAISKYRKAIETYNKVASLSDKDLSYVLFQKALSYGFLEKYDLKINILVDLTTSDQNNLMVDRSLFELAKTYTYIENYDYAINSYNKLLNKYPKSIFSGRSYLNKALILYNDDQLLEAKLILEKTVKIFKGDQVTNQALNTLKEISIETGTVDVFSEWLKKEQINSFSESEISNSAFESIEKYFFEKKNKQAQKQIQDFLLRYPNHSKTILLKYYLADINFQEKQWDNAFQLYEQIINLPFNEYSEKSLVNAILSLQNLNQGLNTELLLVRLKQISVYQENINFANTNLMALYFSKEEFFKARDISNEILNQKYIDSNIYQDAIEVFARSSIYLKDSLVAYEKFKLLEDSPKSILAAEANYYKAYQFFLKGEYEKSNEVIANISNKYGNSGIWSAKSILLMAKNFIELDDSFQSSYILENLIDNFKKFPDIISIAEELLIEVNRKISKRNSSLEIKKNSNE